MCAFLWVVSTVEKTIPVGILHGGAQGGPRDQEDDRKLQVAIGGLVHNMTMDELKYHFRENQRLRPQYETWFDKQTLNLSAEELSDWLRISEHKRASFEVQVHNGEWLVVTKERLEFWQHFMQFGRARVIRCFCHRGNAEWPGPTDLRALNEVVERNPDPTIEYWLVDADGKQIKVTPELCTFLNSIADRQKVFTIRGLAPRSVQSMTLEEMFDQYSNNLLYAKLDKTNWVLVTRQDVRRLMKIERSMNLPAPIEVCDEGTFRRMSSVLYDKLEEQLKKPRATLKLGYVLAFTNIAGYCYQGLTPNGTLCLPHVQHLPEHWTLAGVWPLEPVPLSQQLPKEPIESVKTWWNELGPAYDRTMNKFKDKWIKLTELPLERPAYEYWLHMHAFPTQLFMGMAMYVKLTENLIERAPFLDFMNDMQMPEVISKEELQEAVMTLHSGRPLLLCRDERASGKKILTGIGLCFILKSENAKRLFSNFIATDCLREQNTCDQQNVYILKKGPPPDF